MRQATPPAMAAIVARRVVWSCTLGIAWALVATSCRDANPDQLVPRPLPAPTNPPPGPASPRLSAVTPAQRVVDYKIRATLDPQSHRLEGTTEITLFNRGTTDIHEVPFHLYLNAFKNETSVFMQETAAQGDAEEVSGTRTSDWGWIEVDHIRIEDVDYRVAATFPGPDETVMNLTLPEPLVPGGALTMELAFTAQLPRAIARTGWSGVFHLVAQWYPKVGKRVGEPGAETWSCPPFHKHAEFFADFGNYDVTLTVPTTYAVFATGALVEARAEGASHVLRFMADMVHDFAWVADPWLEETLGTADAGGAPVTVRVVHRPAQRAFARRHLEAAVGTIEYLSKTLTPYPWPTMTVVDPPPEAAATSGMEYPMFVTTAGDGAWSLPGVRAPEFVTIHEVTHNWFQGLIGTDEGAAPWLDEGLNDWLDTVVMEHLYGARTSALAWRGLEANAGAVYRALAGAPAEALQPTPARAPADRFADADDYGEHVYRKTALAFMTLERQLGRATMLEFLASWATRHAFSHPSAEAFFTALAEHATPEIAQGFRAALASTTPFAIEIRSATCRETHAPRGVFGTGAQRTTIDTAKAPNQGAWTCDVTLVRSPAVWTPVVVEFRFADGSTFRDTWPAPASATDLGWHRFSFQRSVSLREVVVDPDDLLALHTNLVATQLRLAPDLSASARAGGRVAHWTQTLMQVVGL